MFYVHIRNNELTDVSEAKYLDEDIINIEIDEQTYKECLTALNKYIYAAETNSIIENPNYETECAQKERERIAMLSLTAADVERAIYKARGMDFDDVIALVEKYNEAAPLCEDGTTSAIDVKALKIELKANNFYRGNPYIDAVGTILGFSKEQLDDFFKTNDYTKLIS